MLRDLIRRHIVSIVFLRAARAKAFRMQFLIIFIATTTVVHGYRHARYYGSEYKLPQRYPRYGRPYVEQNRHYRDSFQQLPQPHLEESNFRQSGQPHLEETPFRQTPQPYLVDQPPPYRDEKVFYSEVESFDNSNSYYPERQMLLKKPLTSYRGHEPSTSNGNHQELNYKWYPKPLNDVVSPSQILDKDQSRQPLSFGGHSNYLNFGNHALGFASVPIKSTSSYNNELPSPSPTATSTSISTSSSLDAYDQSNTPEYMQSATKPAEAMIKTDTPSMDISKAKVESSLNPMNGETNKPLATGANLDTESKPEDTALPSTPIMTMPSEMKRMPFGISQPFTGFMRQNAYTQGGTSLHYNHLPVESKGYQPFELQQSAAPEVMSYMLPPPQQIGAPVKISLPTLPISYLSASASSPLEAIKYLPAGLPKLTFINHGTIHPQTSLSLAAALPINEFGQNAVQLGEIGQLNGQRQGILQGLHLDLDGFGGIGGINYGAQASNSIAKPAVLGIAKVGLSLPEAARSIIPSFTKIGFGQQLW